MIEPTTGSVLGSPSFARAEDADLPAIVALLAAEGLPTADVHQHIGHFLTARDADGRLAGVIGLERYGRLALLRSLCVAPDARDRGLSASLCAALEEDARRAGVEDMYLLTMTARDYFLRRGYVVVDRAAAPAEVQSTAEFRTLCPASAVCMHRRLGPLPATA